MKWTDRRHEDVLERGFWRHLHRVRVAHLVDEVERIGVGMTRPLRLLDLGCGDGVITRRLRRRFPDAVIEAVDADPVRLARARSAGNGAEFQLGRAEALACEDGRFDVVLCHHLVEHVTNDAAVLRECARVLAPGGVLLLGIPHEGGAAGRVLRRLHRRMYADGEHLHFYSIGDMTRLLRAHGFSDVQLAAFGLLWPQYHAHVLLTAWGPTFALGHAVGRRWPAAADSLIFTARKLAGRPAPAEPEAAIHVR